MATTDPRTRSGDVPKDVWVASPARSVTVPGLWDHADAAGRSMATNTPTETAHFIFGLLSSGTVQSPHGAFRPTGHPLRESIAASSASCDARCRLPRGTCHYCAGAGDPVQDDTKARLPPLESSCRLDGRTSAPMSDPLSTRSQPLRVQATRQRERSAIRESL